MPWIKRNLFLVVGGVIALGLLGFAGYFLYDKINKDKAVTEELEKQTADFKELLSRPVLPGNEKINNITLAKEELKQLRGFEAEEQKFFTQLPATNNLNNQEFRSLLDNTIDQLQRGAERSGVALPSKEYWFTFNAQKTSMEFTPANVAGLAGQLDDIKAICDVLYHAKVSSLIGLKRIPLAKEDTAGSADYTAYKATTNQYAIDMPYEVTFQGFTPELARVLEELARTPQCFVAKNVVAEKAPAATPVIPVNPNYDQMQRYPGMQQNPMVDRYGGGAGRYGPPGRYGPMVPQAGPTPPPKPRAALTTVLDENKLRFSLRVDVIKLKPVTAKPSK